MKALFLDRDGVINKEKDYLYRIEDFEFIEGVFEACRYFQSLGYALIIITNQSGIGRGYYSEEAFALLTEWMRQEFLKNHITLLDVYHCPHTPEALCHCRKPNPGMILEAIKKYTLLPEQCWFIGDKPSDIEAANRAGINATILVESGHKIETTNHNATHLLGSIKEAMDIIKS